MIASNGSPIDYGLIILQKDKNIIKSFSCDSMGYFTCSDLLKGTYTMKCSRVNFVSKTLKLSVNKDTSLDITLDSSKKILKEVVVTVNKPILEKKIDRLVYNASRSVTSFSGNATDVLKETPLILVNKESVEIVGKGFTKVMLNGKLLNLAGEDLLEYLKSIPSNSIYQVEIFTIPPAMYDASGNAGLINIITKHLIAKSLNGSLETSFTKGYYSTSKIEGSVNGGFKRLEFYATIGYESGRIRPIEQSVTSYFDEIWNQNLIRKRFIKRTALQIQMNYNISSLSSINFQYSQSTSKPNEPANGTTMVYDKKGLLDSFFVTKNNIVRNQQYSDVTLNYNLMLGNRRKSISISSDYLTYVTKQSQFLNTQNFFPSGEKTLSTINDYTISPQKNYIGTIRLDYSQKEKAFSIDCGVKFTAIKIDNDYTYLHNFNNIFVNDTTRSNHFIYKETTEAVYLGSLMSFRKFDIKGGLRGEFTQVTGKSLNYGQDNQKGYLQVFPTMYLQFKNNNNHIFSLSYGKRVNRPNYWELNPFRYYINPYQYASGNPKLLPSYGNNVDLSYTFNQKYIFGSSMNLVSDNFLQVPFTDPTYNRISYTRENVGVKETFQLYATIPVIIFKRWTATNNLIGFIKYEKDNNISRNNSYRYGSYTLQSNNQVAINKSKTIVLGVILDYISPTRSLFYQFTKYYSVDIGIKFATLQNKLIFGLSASDIFFTGNPRGVSISKYIPLITYLNKDDSRSVKIYLKYNVGLSRTKKDIKKSNVEESIRIH